MGVLWSIYPYVRAIHRNVEIQALCLREKRRIVFLCDDLGSMILWEVSLYACFNEQPCDDLAEYNIARIRKSMDRVNEESL
jgi:hypothetical protein